MFELLGFFLVFDGGPFLLFALVPDLAGFLSAGLAAFLLRLGGPFSKSDFSRAGAEFRS